MYGNILSKSEYALTAPETEPSSPVSIINYGYEDGNWTDKMTSYNGEAITYDEIGNPLTYDGWTFVWEAGRQLKRMTKDGSTVDYKYDDTGIRVSKTVNGITTNFTHIDGKITSQSDGTNFLYFRYDSNDELVGAQINGTEYIYLRNLQGDVISLLDESGQSVVDYTYDAWGKVVSITGALADSIGQLNPMRYRGYYFDYESGYYYLQSRFYNSETCRFLNIDSPQMLRYSKDSALSSNLYTYCLNNPINRKDISGFWSKYFKVFSVNEFKSETINDIVNEISGSYVGYDYGVSTTYSDSSSTFISTWNNMGYENKFVIINSHGNPTSMYNGLTTSQIDSLSYKSGVRCVILLGCNCGHQDYLKSNVMYAFSKKINGVVIASDGTVYSWIGPYFNSSGDKTFSDLCTKGNRSNLGWIMYQHTWERGISTLTRWVTEKKTISINSIISLLRDYGFVYM